MGIQYVDRWESAFDVTVYTGRVYGRPTAYQASQFAVPVCIFIFIRGDSSFFPRALPASLVLFASAILDLRDLLGWRIREVIYAEEPISAASCLSRRPPLLTILLLSGMPEEIL